VDDATGECTDDWRIPKVAGQKRPDLRRVQGTELPVKSNGNAQGEKGILPGISALTRVVLLEPVEKD
jgi:hypothetical protein